MLCYNRLEPNKSPILCGWSLSALTFPPQVDMKSYQELIILPESPEFIVKRSGQTVTFNAAKIRDAIRKAGNAVSDEEITEEKVLSLTNQVLGKIPPHTIPSVEQVQDIVEEVLIANDLPKTSKAYILYRAERSKLRQTEKDLMDIFKSLTFVDAKDSNIKRENANIDTDTAMGTMLKYGSESGTFTCSPKPAVRSTCSSSSRTVFPPDTVICASR